MCEVTNLRVVSLLVQPGPRICTKLVSLSILGLPRVTIAANCR